MLDSAQAGGREGRDGRGGLEGASVSLTEVRAQTEVVVRHALAEVDAPGSRVVGGRRGARVLHVARQRRVRARATHGLLLRAL